MSDLRDFTGKNKKFTGTGSITVPKGTTAQEPTNAAGQLRFDSDRGVLTYNDGSDWYKVSSVLAVLSSVTGDIFAGQNKTLTLTGTGFLSANLVVTFTHSSTDYNVTVTPASDTSATVDTPNALESAVAPGDTVGIKVTNSDSMISGTINKTVTALDFGSQSFTSSGSFNWTAPTDVNEVSVVVVGGGGGTSHGNSSGGGGGGGLAYRNAIPVTPGTSYPIVVGSGGAPLNSGNYSTGPFTGNSGGQSSAFSCTAGGGGAGNRPSGGQGGSGGSAGGTNNGGGQGGTGGSDNNNSGGPGGGGAGGYSGNGGRGGSNDPSNNGGVGATGTAGSGGGGGGGAAGPSSEGGGGGGGGVGILGTGPNGSAGSNPHGGGGGGSSGSNGQNGHQPMTIHPVAGGGDGGNYGGGGGGQNAGAGETGGGAGGAVRIVYGYTSSNVKATYPSNAQD